MSWIGPLISAGSSIIGGLINKSSADDARAANERIAAQNIALQKEFAQTGIQWKVEDAKKAGINPYYALGGSTTSFSPVSIGAVGDTSFGAGISSAGQDISRAIDATRSSGDRLDAVSKARTDLSLKNMSLQNDLLAAQIAKIKSQVGPPMPTASQAWLLPGQGDTSLPASTINDKGMKREGYNPVDPVTEPGAVSDISYSRTNVMGRPSFAPAPSADAMGRMSNDFPGVMFWNIRNRILPSFGFNTHAPSEVPKGYDGYVYNPFTQAYVPVRYPRWMGSYGKYLPY